MHSSPSVYRYVRYQQPTKYRAAIQSFGLWLAFLLLSILVLALIPRSVQGI